MKGLSVMTMRVFVIWMAFAILTYLIYGMRHSRLNVASAT
jgi:hypothetical protein